jgi:hypothetical protein
MKKMSIIIGCLLIALNFHQGLCREKRIVAEGRSTLANLDKEKAYERALDDALRKAVEQGVGVHISSQSKANNYQLIYDEILSMSSGYVQQYKILKNYKKDGMLVVKVSALVKIDDIKNDLISIGVLLGRKKLPRVLVLVNETFMSQLTPENSKNLFIHGQKQSQVEARLASILMEKGFHVLDSKSITKSREKEQAIKILQGKTGAAILLGNIMHADVILIGEAHSNKSGNIAGSNFVSVTKALTLKAIRADTGEILAANTWNSSGAGMNDAAASNNAAKRVADMAGGQLINDVLNKYLAETGGTQMIQLIVYNITSFSDLESLEDELKKHIPGIQQLYRRSFERGIAIFDAQIKGESDVIAHAIQQRPFNVAKVVVTGTSKNVIKLTIKKNRRN